MNSPAEPSAARKLGVLITVILPFGATIYAITQLWQRAIMPLDLVLMLGLYLISGLGITIGFHRLLTHRSFETYPLIRALLLIAGSMAIEGSAIGWAATHIKHHAHSDTADDPHSPLDGLWHAHIGWMLHTTMPDLTIYGSWLLKDPQVRWIDRTFALWATIGMIIPLALGGWQGLLWGGLVRVCLTHHLTWSINSICHTFGGRRFASNDGSRNNWIVGVLAFGEGWHNNHHMFPRAAFHGMRWWEIDLSAYVIRTLGLLGLAWNIWQPSRVMQERRLRYAASDGAEM
jgi:stearoyl-CoA desaturase (Delta-9 desaturase)